MSKANKIDDIINQSIDRTSKLSKSKSKNNEGKQFCIYIKDEVLNEKINSFLSNTHMNKSEVISLFAKFGVLYLDKLAKEEGNELLLSSLGLDFLIKK